jgi:hypothetical protein
MRLNYLQSGGSDQNILNKFTELEYEARNRNQNQVYQTNRQNQIQQNYAQHTHNQIGN